MKDPIGDLIDMVRGLPREAQERFLNHAFTALGHPKTWPTSSGELADLIGTVEELDQWIRKLMREQDLDEHFIVSGLVHSTIEDQRSYAAPEGRSDTSDFWIKRVALFKGLLALPSDERSKLCPDARLRFLLRHAEDELRLVDDYADVAQTAYEQIEAASAEIFDDAYWREYKVELLRMILGQQPDEGVGFSETP